MKKESRRSRYFIAYFSLALGLAILASHGFALAGEPPSSPASVKEEALPPVTVQDILAGVEKRYTATATCAKFEQRASISGVGVTDEASGSVCFKHPDKMMWHYSQPEEQYVISDGVDVFIYRPLDNQVMTGKAKDFFGTGEGASFFSNVKVLKDLFFIEMADEAMQRALKGENCHVLKLIPKKPRPEFAILYLAVDRQTHEIRISISYNEFGDATRIEFSQLENKAEMGDDRFAFQPPKKAEILTMDGSSVNP